MAILGYNGALTTSILVPNNGGNAVYQPGKNSPYSCQHWQISDYFATKYTMVVQIEPAVQKNWKDWKFGYFFNLVYFLSYDLQQLISLTLIIDDVYVMHFTSSR